MLCYVMLCYIYIYIYMYTYLGNGNLCCTMGAAQRQIGLGSSWARPRASKQIYSWPCSNRRKHVCFALFPHCVNSLICWVVLCWLQNRKVTQIYNIQFVNKHVSVTSGRGQPDAALRICSRASPTRCRARSTAASSTDCSPRNCLIGHRVGTYHRARNPQTDSGARSVRGLVALRRSDRKVAPCLRRKQTHNDNKTDNLVNKQNKFTKSIVCTWLLARTLSRAGCRAGMSGHTAAHTPVREVYKYMNCEDYSIVNSMGDFYRSRNCRPALDRTGAKRAQPRGHPAPFPPWAPGRSQNTPSEHMFNTWF